MIDLTDGTEINNVSDNDLQKLEQQHNLQNINFEFGICNVIKKETTDNAQDIIQRAQLFISNTHKIFTTPTLQEINYDDYLQQAQVFYSKIMSNDIHQQNIQSLQQLKMIFYACWLAKLMTNLGIQHTQRQRYKCLHRNKVPKHLITSSYIKTKQELLSKNTAIRTISAQMGAKRNDTSRTRLQRVKATGISNATTTDKNPDNSIEHGSFWLCKDVHDGNRLVKVFETRFKSKDARVPVSSITINEPSCYGIVEILHYNPQTKQVQTFISTNRFTYVHSSQFLVKITLSQTSANVITADIDAKFISVALPLLTTKLSKFNYHLTGKSQKRNCPKCGKEYQKMHAYNTHVPTCDGNNATKNRQKSNYKVRKGNNVNKFHNIPTDLHQLNEWLKYETLTLNEYNDRIMLLSDNHKMYGLSIINSDDVATLNSSKTTVLLPLPVPSSIRQMQTCMTDEKQRLVIGNKMILSQAECNMLVSIGTKTIQRSSFVSFPNWFELAASLKQSKLSLPYNRLQVLDGVTTENVQTQEKFYLETQLKNWEIY